MSYAVINDRATEYARRVAAGKVTAGKLHILACKRHLNDLKRQNTKDFPYYYNPAKANEIINYADTLTIAEGDKPKAVKLIDSQAFDMGVTFGWFKCANDKRRFRRRYKSVARQNGKTFENGIMGTYIGGFGGYNYGKLFTVATKKRQARLAWEEMSKFITIDPDLNEYFDIKDYKSLILAKKTACTIEALSKESGLDDGFRSIFCSVDEIHQHRDNKIYKALYNGTRSLDETLISMITTRGYNLNSFCKEMDDYCVEILKGNTTAEDFFVDIYCLDPEDNWFDPAVWIKANPFLCSDEEKLKIFMNDVQTAKDMGGEELRDFVTKALNLWFTNGDNDFVDSEKWKKCGSEKKLSAFKDCECWVGLDLSSGGDLTTLAIEFETEENKYYFHSHSFMPKGRLYEHIQTDLAPYDVWERMDLITVTGSSGDFKNDYKFILSYLKKLQDEYNLKIKGIGVDPHNADGILSDLESFGAPVVLVTQSCRNLNDATVDLQLSVKSEIVEYDKENELLSWSFINAVTVKNSFDEIKVDKKPNARHKRIDPVDACIDAHYLVIKSHKTDANENMENYLTAMGWD